MIDEFERVERLSKAHGVTFAEAMRLVSGARPGDGPAEHAVTREWSEVATGAWLRDTLAGLRSPEGLARLDAGQQVNATLRPYQQTGVRWLCLLHRSAWAPAWPTTWAWARRSR